MDVFLVRHAAAEAEARAPPYNDANRPLTQDGAAAFRVLARRLGDRSERPAVVLASPARRALETAAILRETLAWPIPRPEPGIGAGVDLAEYLRVLHHERADSIALIAHNPTISQLAMTLLQAKKDAMEPFEPGTMALLRRTGVGGAATLVYRASP